MAVVNAGPSDLTNISSILRWVTDELITNHRFTARFGDVNASAVWTVTDALRWMDRPQAETFYQDSDLAIGVRNSPDTRSADGVPISLGIQIGRSLFSVFDPGLGNRWDDSDWRGNATVRQHVQPEQGDTVDLNVGAPCGVSGMEGGPFIQARLVTSPTSTSATPSEPLYFYVVVETSIGVFRKFGWGEVCKFYDWTGGIFAMGDVFSTASNFYTTNQALFGSGLYSSSFPQNNNDEAPSYIYAPGWTGITDPTNGAEGRGWMTGMSGSTGGASSQQRAWPALGWDPRGGLNFMSQSPSGFSLQSERNPAIIFGGNQRRLDGIDFEVHPMGQFPDLFQAVITDVDAYSVFQELDGSRYMVVPHRTKLVDENTNAGSGRFGLLIRNAGLTVS